MLVTAEILAMDRDGDRVWGYALSKRSGVATGVIYPQLERMLDRGWLIDHWENPPEGGKRPPRRYYVLTDAGREHLRGLLRQAKLHPRFASRGWDAA